MLTLNILLTAIAAYAVLCGFVYLGQHRIVYLDWVIPFKSRVTELAGARELRFSCGEASLRIWTLHQELRPALLYFGGSAEDVRINLASFDGLFPDRAIYLVSYRGYPGSTGRPSEARLIGDAEMIFDSVADRHERIAVAGKSLGTGVATALAARRHVEKLVLITPFDSLANVAADCLPFLPARRLLKDGYNSVRRISQIRAPVLVVVAEKDGLVLRPRTDALIAAVPAALRHVRIIHGAAHTNIRRFSEYGRSLKEFVADHSLQGAGVGPERVSGIEAHGRVVEALQELAAGNASGTEPVLGTRSASPS
jgi:pimeloyl-ACP methyl ester carboxylesterase